MGIADEIRDLKRRMSEIERQRAASVRTGVVASVDPAGGLVRVRLSDGDAPFLTGWLPWSEPAAGANKTHNPPSEGQQVSLFSESGDLHDAFVQGSLNSDANGRPSGAGDEFVLLSVGSASIRATGGGSSIVFSVGGYSLTLSAGGAVNSGGALSHDGKNIGKDHTHKGVQSGPVNSGPPN